jgi:hypothetical protein
MNQNNYITEKFYLYFQLLFASRNVTFLLHLLLSRIKSLNCMTKFGLLRENDSSSEKVLSE